jgi:putative spermidine/putrescine transport system substrate-binding protein
MGRPEEGQMGRSVMMPSRTLWTRRAAAKLIAGAATAVLAPRIVRAAEKTVYLLTWGGTIQAMLERDGWSKKFAAATGYEVVLVPKATGVEIMATAIAQKSKPQVDVVQSDLLPWLGGIEQGIFAPIDKLYDPGVIKDPESGQIIGVEPYGDIFCLIYNKDVFARKGWAPPSQWTDLERPEMQGQLLIPPASSVYALYTLIILARAHGGGEKNIEPGFDVMKKIGPGVVDWSDTFAKMSQFLADETASLAIHGIAGALDMISRKLPVAYVVPSPVYMSPTAMGVMKGGPNPEGARAFVNWWISEEVQSYRAETYGQTVMNREVKLSDAAAAKLPSKDKLAQLVEIDYGTVLKNRQAWSDRLQREVQNK